ncbi:hypothetical protein [Aggregatibacter segnis]|jgi:hypothetical protein|uniref:Uncharacterized protein n=1 Tax=Aggregatibacter segnis TaxID=739 RepID=A0A8B2U2T0_9PAST|nr:hypothetical protein [Aggregatibacter segnis]RDE72230.1 hypothetical protein DPV83_01020 [Aggregatibacter segnis]
MKVICLILFSLLSSVFVSFTMFLLAKFMYNIENNMPTFDIDLVSFFVQKTAKEIKMIIFLSVIIFVVFYMYYKKNDPLQ